MAEITFRRIFHPVGQGAFFTEHFVNSQSRIHIVYDCGSMNRTRVNNEISCFANSNIKGDHIACIFISHFDMDHVNGLDKLRKVFTVNDKTFVFVPFFYEEVYVYLSQFNDNYLKAYNILKRFIKKTGAQLIMVSPLTNDNRPVEPFVINEEKGIIDNRKEIASGTPIHIQDSEKNVIWKYIPYNITTNQTIEGIVLEGLQKTGAIKGCRFNIELLSYPTKGMSKEEIKLMASKRQKLRRIFTKLGKGSYSENINMNSLQLLSLPNDPTSCTDYCRYSICDSYFGDYYKWNKGYTKYKFENAKIYPGSCLYTGDTFANSDDFWKAFDTILVSNLTRNYSRLSLFQIPHHGSKHSNNNRIVSDNRIYATFTNFDANRKNQIYDPNINLQFYLHQKPLILITEEEVFRFEECWTIK